MKPPEIFSFANADELARAVAGAWLDEIESAKRAGKVHSVALSGGRITQNFFAAVVELAKTRKIGDGGTPSLPTNVHFFWADERCVPPADPESNFKMANDLLFAPLKISENQIHRIRGEDAPDAAAKNAEAELRRARNDAPCPVLDLVFLGLGEDGHVASLFPGESEKMLADPAVYRAIKNSPKPPPNRVTLGYPAIAAARQVWMLASGTGKEAALRESLSPSGRTPFGRVLRLRSQTKIFTDISL